MNATPSAYRVTLGDRVLYFGTDEAAALAIFDGVTAPHGVVRLTRLYDSTAYAERFVSAADEPVLPNEGKP